MERSSQPRRGKQPSRTPGRASRAASGAAELVAVAAKQAGGGGPGASKVQQRFARLVKKVERLRLQLRAWQERRPAIETAIAAYDARCVDQQRLLHRMVLVLDAAYDDPIFGKRDRKQLANIITSLAGQLLEVKGYEDVKPLYNRYGRRDFDAETAAAEKDGVDALKAVLDLFGLDPGDGVHELDDMAAHAAAQVRALHEEEEAARQRRRTRRKKSPKQAEREARIDAERQHASKAVQEVYRTLAMALHPDLEQDLAERARKSELMREVNVAHEAKDLLRLLELQLELERVDPERVSLLARRFDPATCLALPQGAHVIVQDGKFVRSADVIRMLPDGSCPPFEEAAA
jgi:hypothetical protein